MFSQGFYLYIEKVRSKMSFYLKNNFPIFALVIISLFSFTGCSDDEPTQPQDLTNPTFTNIWPASVGTHMVFELHNQTFHFQEGTFETPDDIPEIPSMETLYAQLQDDNWGDPASIDQSLFNLKFIDDQSNVDDTIKLAVSEWYDHIEGRAFVPSPLKIMYHWTQSVDRISSTLGDLTYWLHLDSSLIPGQNFSAEIVGTEETHLDSRIWKIRSFSNMNINHPACVECFYVVDMGIQTVRDYYGAILGYYHPYSFGVVIYAPGVGPVFCQEKIMLSLDVWENRQATLLALGNGSIY